MSKETGKKKGIKREIIEWAIFLSVFGILYVTGLHTPVIGFLQRGILATGLMTPNTEEVGIPADYNLQLVDASGQEVNLREWQSETIFLNFWATWCPPCIAEMPDIDNLYQEMGDQVHFALISVDKDPGKAIEFVNAKGFGAPIYFLKSPLPQVYQSSAIPTTYVISPEGQIVVTNKGMAKYNTEKFRSFLTTLNSQQVP